MSAFPEPKIIFSVSGWFCISSGIYCFESFSLIILFSRLLLQWQSQQQQLVNEIQNNRFFQIIFSHLLVKNIIGLEYNCLVCLCKSMPVCLHVPGRNKIVNFIIYINLGQRPGWKNSKWDHVSKRTLRKSTLSCYVNVSLEQKVCYTLFASID